MKINKPYKVERRIGNTNKWYDVMLSPFNTPEEVHEYLNKYSRYYPSEDRYYRVTKDSGKSIILHL
jgi:hypothetical protein